MNACHRGCRLYSICQFVNGNAGFNTSREECQGGRDCRLSVCLSVVLSVVCLSVCLWSVYMWFVCLSVVWLYVVFLSLSVCLYVVCLSVCGLSVCGRSVCGLSVCGLSVCLSVCYIFFLIIMYTDLWILSVSVSHLCHIM